LVLKGGEGELKTHRLYLIDEKLRDSLQVNSGIEGDLTKILEPGFKPSSEGPVKEVNK